MIPDWIELRTLGDERGSLAVIEAGKQVPFAIRRVYYIFGTKPEVTRGMHAHHRTRQAAFAVRGKCAMLLDDGATRISLTLEDPAKGVMLEPMVWHEMSEFSPDCVLLVLADAEYDESDYIRNYGDFTNHVHSSQS